MLKTYWICNIKLDGYHGSPPCVKYHDYYCSIFENNLTQLIGTPYTFSLRLLPKSWKSLLINAHCIFMASFLMLLDEQRAEHVQLLDAQRTGPFDRLGFGHVEQKFCPLQKMVSFPVQLDSLENVCF